jgi:hypothetical protein
MYRSPRISFACLDSISMSPTLLPKLNMSVASPSTTATFSYFSLKYYSASIFSIDNPISPSLYFLIYKSLFSYSYNPSSISTYTFDFRNFAYKYLKKCFSKNLLLYSSVMNDLRNFRVPIG